MRTKQLLSACIGSLLIGCLTVVGPVLGESPLESKKPGEMIDGGKITRDGSILRPAGQAIPAPGKPMDIEFSPDGEMMFIKATGGLNIYNAKTFTYIRTVKFKNQDNKDEAGSMHGLVVTKGTEGSYTVYFTTRTDALFTVKIAADGSSADQRRIPLTGSHNYGLAVSDDGKLAYVCMSTKNAIGIVDLAEGKLIKEVPVSVCPYDISLSPDGRYAYVTNYGGRRPTKGQLTAKSAQTDVLVDNRSIPVSGSVSRVDLQTMSVVNEINVELHPNQIIRNKAGTRYYVANANSDTISVIDGKRNVVIETIGIRLDDKLLFGSMPDALSLSPDEKTLYVANAGNNAVAVVSLAQEKITGSKIIGFIPTGWFPSAIMAREGGIFVSNAKSGNVLKIDYPTTQELADYTARTLADAQVPRQLKLLERSQSTLPPAPVPLANGQRSVFKHVVYILKENKTYDQVFGAIGKGNSEPKFCTYGRNVTPNQHALAEQFVLLDNYYCNGVNSSDGHQWATQGIVSEYFEKGSRTYDFGTDALCYAASNFIWDSCLMGGLSIRNYGEFDYATVESKNWFDNYAAVKNGTFKFKQQLQFDSLAKYTCPDFPGWNMSIPDQHRADIFLKEFAEFEKNGNFPDFTIIYLPQDHGAGTSQTYPTPRATVADNDLATGRIVEAISNSKFWKETVIFINEDDPQSGSDHVDGHRSICMVVSPYTKRNEIVSNFYNQASMLHTMTRILGLPPMNQACAMAPTMEACFTDKPDFTPFKYLPSNIPLDERNPVKSSMSPEMQKLHDEVANMDFSEPDKIKDDTLNRLNWLSAGRTDPYPAEFSGAHGKGLSKLGLKFDPSLNVYREIEEDDE